MRIAVASDHAGFSLKEHLKAALTADGHDVLDAGTTSDASTDYPEHAAKAARAVAAGDAERGIVVCGSGNGVTITANKIAGIRAVNAHDAEEAAMARRHNGINVLGLSQARLDGAAAGEIVRTFLTTDFEGGRHERRIGEIADVERGGAGAAPVAAGVPPVAPTLSSAGSSTSVVAPPARGNGAAPVAAGVPPVAPTPATGTGGPRPDR